MEIEGFAEVSKKIQQLKDKEIKRIARKAARASLKPAHEEAIMRASIIDDTKTIESIAENIAIRTTAKKYSDNGDIKSSLGIQGGAKKGGKGGPGGDTFYWRFVELGTSKVQSRPFLRDSFKPEIAAAIFTEVAAKDIHKAVKKL